MILWRISQYPTLDGGGGLYGSARWHSLGRRIVYFAESPAGALIEVLVHLELRLESLPKGYRLIKVEAGVDASTERIDAAGLKEGWQESVRVTQRIGDSWLESRSSAFLAVPSVIVPETSNWLFNPEHSHSRMVSLKWHRPFPVDTRLLRLA
jgi:RES domain-containing protein